MGLDSVEIVVDLEDTFGVHIPDEVGEKIRTPGELADVFCAAIEASGRSWPKSSGRVDRDEVFKRVAKVVSMVTGVPLERVTPSANLVKDLGVD